MGSRITSGRKKTDSPLIMEPQSLIQTISSNKGMSEIAAEKCPSSFEERLEESPFTKDGLNLSIVKENDRFLIMVQGTEIGRLSKRNSDRIITCLDLSIRYAGKIVKKNNEYYARFFRETD